MHFSQNYLRFIKFSIACDFLLQSSNTRFGMPYYLKTFKKQEKVKLHPFLSHLLELNTYHLDIVSRYHIKIKIK